MKILRVLLRIEWLKAVRRRAFWVAFAAFTVLPVIEGVRHAHSNPNAVFALPENWPVILGTAAGIGPLFITALMILLVAHGPPERDRRTKDTGLNQLVVL